MTTPEAQRSHATTVAKELLQNLGEAGAVAHVKKALQSLLGLNASAEMMYGWALVMVAVVEESQ
jgi:hypothetical protein